MTWRTNNISHFRKIFNMSNLLLTISSVGLLILIKTIYKSQFFNNNIINPDTIFYDACHGKRVLICSTCTTSLSHSGIFVIRSFKMCLSHNKNTSFIWRPVHLNYVDTWLSVGHVYLNMYTIIHVSSRDERTMPFSKLC